MSEDGLISGSDKAQTVINELTGVAVFSASDANLPLPGKSLGRYRLDRPLAAGGMGLVFEAYDPELERRVAIKVLRPDQSTGLESRLVDEARAIARLSHPNVVSIYDVGVGNGRVFVAMELVRGRSLQSFLRDNPPWAQIVPMLTQAGRGLEAAHRADLVHLDFKPANVLVGDDGRARVLDFGLARPRDELVAEHLETVAFNVDIEAPLTTKTGLLIGTPAYMAPEQIAHGDVDARTDQFAFCVVLFEALFGHRPFSASTLQGLRRALVSGVFRFPFVAQRLPECVRGALARGLSARPEARFRAMGELLDVLEQAFPRHSSQVEAPPDEPETPGFARMRAYLSTLPHGIQSYPDCLMASAPVRFLSRRLDRTDPGVSALAERVFASADRWALEAALRAQLLVLQGERDETEWRALQRAAFRMVLTARFQSFWTRGMASSRILEAMAQTWCALHRGTELKVLASLATGGQLSLTHPAGLIDEQALSSVRAELEAALELGHHGYFDVSLLRTSPAQVAIRVRLE